MESDQIIIAGLRLPTQIGVPDSERAAWQSIEAHLTLVPHSGFRGIEDAISATIDYDAVARQVRALAAARPRKLLETLAEEIATALLATYPLKTITLELRKFILPDTTHVAVRITRQVD